MISRRHFFGALGIGAVLLPLASDAQQAAIPRVGFLNTASSGEFAHLVSAFRQGLRDSGYIEGESVTIEYRWAEGQYEQLPALAADLVRRRVAAIVATGGEPAARAAKEATQTIPIIFALAQDPVAAGLVVSFNRPGGNATGVTVFPFSLAAKRVELLHELLPSVATIAVLVNTHSPTAGSELGEVRAAARSLGQEVQIVDATSEREFGAAFATLAQRGARALLVGGDASFTSRRDQLIALAAHHAIPAIYGWREYATAGGLMSYGTNLADAYRQVGIYTGRILKGAKPADLPVVQPTKFEFVINLRTAKALGLTIPQSLLLRADELIQ